MPIRFAPGNIRNGKSSAPESSERVSSAHTHLLRFPVFNRGRPLITDLLVYGLASSFVLMHVYDQMAYHNWTWSKDYSAFSYAFLPVLGFLMLFNRELSQSRWHQAAMLACAFFLHVLSLIVSQWFFHALIGLGAACVLLDALIVHGLALRSHALSSPGAHSGVAHGLSKRFSLKDPASVSLLSYLFPILIMATVSFTWRSKRAERIEVTGEFESTEFLAKSQIETGNFFNPLDNSDHVLFLLSMLFALIALPLVFDFLAPVVGLARFGPRRLFKEFMQLLHSWFFYNAAGARHPSILCSTSGSCLQRRIMFLGANLLLIPVAMPLSTFQGELDKAREEKSRELRYYFRLPKTENAYQIAFRQLDESTPPSDSQQFSTDSLDLQLDKNDATSLEEMDREISEAKKATKSAEEAMQQDSVGRSLVDSPGTLLRGFPNLLLAFLSPVNPTICLLCILFSGTCRVSAGLTPRVGPLPNSNSFTTANWPALIGRLEAINRRAKEQDILWGLDARDQTPVIVPRAVLREHAHFLGDTGSGKTALGISPLIAQLLRHGDCSVLVIDMKGDDQSLFELMRDGCRSTSNVFDGTDSKRWSYPFSYFTVDPDKPCHTFNPFRQKSFQLLTPLQKTDLLTTALGLQYGTDYGRKYYGDANFTALLKTLERQPAVDCFRNLEPEIVKTMRSQMDRESKAASTNLLMSVQRLATIPSLNSEPTSPEETIDLGNYFEVPQAAYFSLPAATGSVVNADVGRLLLYGLIDAAQRAPKPRRQVFLVIDEFQRLVSKNVEVVLQMARSLDVGIILSNQSMSDLDQVDAKILPTVMTNTRVRQIFGVSDPIAIKQLVDLSGERSLFLRTFSNVARRIIPFGLRADEGYSETISPRLRGNDLIEASDHPLRSIFLLRRGQGSAQYGGYPFVMESVFHIPENQYQQRVLAPWPNATVTTKIWKTTEPTPSEKAAVFAPPIETSSPDVSVSVSEVADPNSSEPIEAASDLSVSESVDRLLASFDDLGKKHKQ